MQATSVPQSLSLLPPPQCLSQLFFPLLSLSHTKKKGTPANMRSHLFLSAETGLPIKSRSVGVFQMISGNSNDIMKDTRHQDCERETKPLGKNHTEIIAFRRIIKKSVASFFFICSQKHHHSCGLKIFPLEIRLHSRVVAD